MRLSESLISINQPLIRVVFSDPVRRLILESNSLTVYKGMHWAHFSPTWSLWQKRLDNLANISHKEFDYLHRVFKEMLKSKIWHKEPDAWNTKGKKRAAKKNIGKDRS